MKYKIYISLPIGGQENTVRFRFDNAVEEVKNQFGDVEIISPVNIDKFDYNGLTTPRDHDWAWYMGQDLERLLRCDFIFMCKGYLNSPGCRVELAVARERDIKVVYADDAKDFLKSKAICKD